MSLPPAGTWGASPTPGGTPLVGIDLAPPEVPATQPIADRPHTGRYLDFKDWLIAGGLALCVAVAGWVFRAALIPIDPWDYVEGARNFPNGVWNEAGLSRWGMIVPLLLLTRLWGDAEATYYVYPLLAGGLLAAVLYLLGARLVNRVTGMAGAALTMAVPVVFVHLSRGYPDLIAITFIAGALLFLILARDASTSGWRSTGWLLAAGAFTGWSFEVRELSVLAFPALGVALLRVGRPLRSLPLFALPALVILAADFYLNARYFDDALLKIHWLAGNSIDNSIVAADLVYVGHERSYYLTIAFRMLAARTGGLSVLLIAGFGLVAGALLWRRLGPLWFWGASQLVLLLALGGFLRPASPSIRLDIIRYNLAYLVPLVMTAACAVGVLVVRSQGWRRVAAVGLAGVMGLSVLVPAVRFTRTFEGYVTNGGGALRELGDYLGDQPDISEVQVWADWGTQRLVPVYSTGLFGGAGWTARNYRSLNRLLREPPISPARQPQPGDIIVVYSKGEDTCYHCAQALTEVEAAYGQFPLPGWQEVFRSGNGNVVAYQLPSGYTWPEPSPIADTGESEADAAGEEAP